MRTIGSYELKTHLAEVLQAVEQGQTVVMTRRGKPIARISPDSVSKREQVKEAIKAIENFPRTPLPKGMTVRDLIEQGRR